MAADKNNSAAMMKAAAPETQTVQKSTKVEKGKPLGEAMTNPAVDSRENDLKRPDLRKKASPKNPKMVVQASSERALLLYANRNVRGLDYGGAGGANASRPWRRVSLKKKRNYKHASVGLRKSGRCEFYQIAQASMICEWFSWSRHLMR